MKKFSIAALTLMALLAVGVTGYAQNGSQDSYGGSTDKSTTTGPQLMTIKGTVKADGDKITFVTDKDNKNWSVMNPEVLKGHEGHHVELSAHVDAEKNTIHVMKVKMLKANSK